METVEPLKLNKYLVVFLHYVFWGLKNRGGVDADPHLSEEIQ